MNKGLGADTNFELGKPFRPFEQLMGVLPDRSQKIVPPAYRELMTSQESPIIDFYPRDFELDMNGKKMEWEAVVKIPFIEEERLLSAIATRRHLLSPEEVARDDFGVSLKFTYAPDVSYIYPSSLPGVFPDIPNCHCVENVFDLPVMDGLEPYAGLIDGVLLGESALAGFPSLKTLPHYGQLGFHGVTVFQQESRNESMVITLLDPGSRSNIELAKKKLCKRVYVGYPCLQEALVVRVSDELFDYVVPRDEEHVLPIPHTPPQIEQWKRKSDKIENYYSKRLGVVIGPVDSIVHVRLLKGLIKTEEGATLKEFAEIPGQETDHALQLVVDEVINPDQRFVEREALPIEEEFPVESRAFFLGDFNYGRPVHISGHENGRVNGMIASVKGREPEFGRARAKEASTLCPYMPSYAIARALDLNALVLAKITSSFSVDVGGQRVNLGLNLKFEAKKQKVLGYSRRGDSGWEFSQKAVDLITEYMMKFPEFFAGIQRNPQGDRYTPTDFYPEEIANLKIKEIQSWLKEIESKSFERVPLDADQLDSDVVKLIEQDADINSQNSGQIQPKKLRGVPRAALLKPSDAEQRLGNQRFALGDRVVYAQDSGKVPIATRGTVIGLTRTARIVLLDVVFDASFMSGTTLGDRCSPFRGQTVPAFSVLNVTYRQLITNSRAAVNHQAQFHPVPMTVAGGYGAPIGPGGRGQLRNAPAPPPLRGSFRGAVAPQVNGRGTFPGARGSRGGLNGVRGGLNGVPRGPNALPFRPHANVAPHQRNSIPYGRIDDDPDSGVVQDNLYFKPRNYNQAPPPQSLEWRPSRGRGGFRGNFRGSRGGAPAPIRGSGDGFRGRGSFRGRGATAATAQRGA